MYASCDKSASPGTMAHDKACYPVELHVCFQPLWSAILSMSFWLDAVSSQLSATETMSLWLADESSLCLFDWLYMEQRHHAQEPTVTSLLNPFNNGASNVTVQALAEKESDGMAKMIYRKDTGDILGVHIFGLHAADLIHEASNAMATHQRVQVCLPCPSWPCTNWLSLLHSISGVPGNLLHCLTALQSAVFHWHMV